MQVILATQQQHFFQICYIRHKVFVEEQAVSLEEELDQLDYDCWHFLLLQNEVAIGCCRLIRYPAYLKLGRLAVLKSARHQGGATQLLKYCEQFALKQGYSLIKLGAQLAAVELYEKNGYQTQGKIFLDANIEHIMMEKKLCE